MRLSQQPGLQVQAVAAALDIHPFMLSKWRKQVRDGVLRGQLRELRLAPVREIRRLQELERAHALLQEEHELLKKSHPVLFRSKAEVFAFIATQRDQFTLRRLCALYGLSRAGYYAWRHRPQSAHAEQDRKLSQRIVALFQTHRGRYGSPRIHNRCGDRIMAAVEHVTGSRWRLYSGDACLGDPRHVTAPAGRWRHPRE